MHYRTLIPGSGLVRSGPPPDWVVLDCRFDLMQKEWGETVYRQGHIPGAHYAHLERDLSGPGQSWSGRHPLPDWQLFAELLGQWGVYPETQVIVYDQDNGSYAARAWWMLRALGHRAVAVLDGGWSAWLAAGGAVDVAIPSPRSLRFQACPGSGWINAGQVHDNLESRELVLVDARSRERFLGRQEPIDPVAGHIPGALNRPLDRNLAAQGGFLEPGLLRAQWQALLGDWPSDSVVHYCGSGVTACHNLLAMEIAGMPGSTLYAGSWSEWILDPRRPVATGSD